MRPLMSIIMPFYNVEKYINLTLESVANQKDFPLNELEIIAINDGSVDKSLEKIKKFMNTHSNLQTLLINHDKNKGTSIARNNGAKLANGKFLLYLDGDDLIHPDCLSLVAKTFDNYPSVGFVYSDHSTIKHSTSIRVEEQDILNVKNKPDFDIKTFLERDYNYVGHIKVVHKEVNLPFDPKLRYSEDADWIIRLSLKPVNFYHIPKVLYFWRRGIDSISSRTSKDERERCHNYVFQKGLESLNKNARRKNESLYKSCKR